MNMVASGRMQRSACSPLAEYLASFVLQVSALLMIVKAYRAEKKYRAISATPSDGASVRSYSIAFFLAELWDESQAQLVPEMLGSALVEQPAAEVCAMPRPSPPTSYNGAVGSQKMMAAVEGLARSSGRWYAAAQLAFFD